MPSPLYSMLCDRARANAIVRRVLLGLSWSLAQVETEEGASGSAPQTGLCFSPVDANRVINWSGTLVGRSSDDLISWIHSWDSCEAAVGTAVLNAVINHRSNDCLARSQSIVDPDAAHLSVFSHFAPLLQGAKVSIIGRYPGIERFSRVMDFTCIERRPGAQDLPDSAAEFVLPKSDWVFITASSLANKTLPRLLQLSRHATVVLMGPTLPWLTEWRDFGVNYLAGVEVKNPELLQQVIAEGGGTRIFQQAVGYRLLEL